MAVTEGKRGFSFHGTGGTLFGIQIVNLFLIILTLGIYSFWGRVKVRKFIWGGLEFEGDRFTYSGTGGELFRGFLKALVLFIIPYILLTQAPVLAGLDKTLIIGGSILGVLLLLCFIPIAVVGTRRYRLSRTTWRGVHFNFQKRGKDYIGLFLGGYFLMIITLFLYGPWFDAKNCKFLISNSRVGNRNFDYDGNGKDLFGSYLLAILLFIPTLYFSLFWFMVKRKRYVWNHTTFGEARFNCTITTWEMFKLYFVNALIVVFTLGFGAPWAKVRTLNYLASRLTLDGKADIEAVLQEAAASSATGDELSTFLDLDFDLG
jgi:uncharacterized membrane protein YjgN (DUF898 family)